MQEINKIQQRLPGSLEDNTVKVAMNIHVDDASMVNTKVGLFILLFQIGTAFGETAFIHTK